MQETFFRNVDAYPKSTQHHTEEDHDINIRLPENSKSYTVIYPENGGRRFLRNVDTHLPQYIASHSRIQ
jgi:hypothetical protein